MLKRKHYRRIVRRAARAMREAMRGLRCSTCGREFK